MIVIFVALDNRLETLRQHVPEVLAILPRLRPGEVVQIGA
jgi:hypothetical protein